MEKCFNIAGPCFPDEHYMLPALERLPGIMRIVEQRSYFVLHAARQSETALGSKRLDLCVEFGKFRVAQAVTGSANNTAEAAWIK